MKTEISNKRSLLLTGMLFLMTLGAVSAEGAKLDESDMVGVSFWLATAMMLASTVFFIMERNNVAAKWKTSMTVAALVTGVAWYHYTYMREHWANAYAAEAAGGAEATSPLVLRYIDWLITVPLQVAEFYLILAAVGAAGIPSAGLVTMVIVISAVNSSLPASVPVLPLAAIGIILGVDRILDMCRTTVNVWGDATAAKVMTRLAPDEPDEGSMNAA